MREGVDGEFGFATRILTQRLWLRMPDAADRAAVKALAANPRVAENLAAAPGEWTGPRCASLAVVEREANVVIGAAAYGAIADRPGAVEIATWVGEPHWGRGYATEATQALIDHVFADERTRILWCANRASSTRSRRVVEKCGFQYRGTGMVRSPSLNGAVPVERFVLERRNWESLKAWGARDNRMEHDDAPRDNAA